MINEYCPIRNGGNCSCMGKLCAWWDEEKEQCCVKGIALAVTGNKGGGSSPTAQAYYIPPSSYCHTDARSNTYFETNPVYNGGL